MPDSKSRRPRVLIISLFFYPCSVIGAHRGGKFCKYLPQHGYDVSVLTIDPHEVDWHVDEHLTEQIPRTTEIIHATYPYTARLRKLVTGLYRRLGQRRVGGVDGDLASEAATVGKAEDAQAWLVPDKDILWAPWALQAGLRAARCSDVIFATAPTFSVLVIGALLKRLVARPLIIDLRDPWVLSELRGYPRAVHRRLDAWLERWTFRQADVIICNTEAVRKAYERSYSDLPTERFVVIPNGYDEDDFVGMLPVHVPGKVRLGYFGKIYAGRDPGPLFRAARTAMDAGLISPSVLEFVFYGPSNDIVAAAAATAGVTALIRLYPTVPYAEALRAMATCDGLLILGSPETDRLHVPGKAFEYLGMRKPVLALAGPGALDDLMKRYRFGLRVSPDDPDAISAALRELCANVLAGTPEKYLGSACGDLTRRRLTGDLAAVLDRARRIRKTARRRSEASAHDDVPVDL